MTREGQDKIYQIITDRMTAALEAGTVPWHRPWHPESGGGLPVNLKSSKAYRGVNVWLLGLTALEAGYTSPWWGTIKQINERGGHVRKGEHPTLVVFWKRYTKRVTDPDTGDVTDKPSFVLTYYKVFNAQQTEGLPAKFQAPPP